MFHLIHVCMCTTSTSVPTEDRRGLWIFCNCSCGWLRTIMWVLGVVPGSSSFWCCRCSIWAFSLCENSVWHTFPCILSTLKWQEYSTLPLPDFSGWLCARAFLHCDGLLSWTESLLSRIQSVGKHRLFSEHAFCSRHASGAFFLLKLTPKTIFPDFPSGFRLCYVSAGASFTVHTN